ncbi:hypothetical protein [Mycobacterium tuberculosis]|uniref:hypothetical protein n=1 Tax=Mycobacterium tuberculosis TaxID=1773 RepID=UPI000459DE48|nr:hypothetical protein W023_02904 [Mycobacterium tuberculosis TB_RSA113]
MSQLSFFAAESVPPAVADLSGVLAGPGQIVLVGCGARLSVVVAESWRASALAEMIQEAGLVPEVARTDENTPLVRTAVDPLLCGIAAEWTRGAVKTVPPRWLPGPRELRAWTLAAGSPEADRYLLGLDPHAPDTHSPLASGPRHGYSGLGPSSATMRSRWGPLRSRAVGPSSATMRSRWGPLRSRAVGPSSATMRISERPERPV